MLKSQKLNETESEAAFTHLLCIPVEGHKAFFGRSLAIPELREQVETLDWKGTPPIGLRRVDGDRDTPLYGLAWLKVVEENNRRYGDILISADNYLAREDNDLIARKLYHEVLQQARQKDLFFLNTRIMNPPNGLKRIAEAMGYSLLKRNDIFVTVDKSIALRLTSTKPTAPRNKVRASDYVLRPTSAKQMQSLLIGATVITRRPAYCIALKEGQYFKIMTPVDAPAHAKAGT